VDPIAITIAVLDALVEQVGIPLVVKWLAAKSPQDQTQALLDAEYAAARAAADAEAAAVLKP
jgi:hypothetical protein